MSLNLEMQVIFQLKLSLIADKIRHMLSIEHQEFLRENTLFSEFSDTEFTKISAQVSLCKATDQQFIFKQDQVARNFFLLVEGKIKLAFLSPNGSEKVVDVIRPGHSFAEAIMFFERKKYPLNANSLGHSKVLCINVDNYLKMLEVSPKSCFRIMGKLSQRLHWATGEIGRLVLHDGKYRLIKFLLANARQVEKSNSVHLFVSKNILASQLSIKPETLSRILKELSKQGLIEVNNSHILLLRPLELESLVNI